MEAIWILIGIIYVIYKLWSEDYSGKFKVGFVFALCLIACFGIPALVLWGLNENGVIDIWEDNIGLYSMFIGSMIALFICLIVNREKVPAIAEKRRENDLSKILATARELGYEPDVNIVKRIIADDPHLNYNEVCERRKLEFCEKPYGYNYEKTNAALEYPMNKMKVFGVPPNEYVKRAIAYILMREGFCHDWVKLTYSEPNQIKFNEYLDKKFSDIPRYRQMFRDAGYHLSNELVDRVVTDELSPVNYKDVNSSVQDCYNWLLRVRINEITFDKKDRYERLGIPKNHLPLNPKMSFNTVGRDELVVMKLLIDEGFHPDDVNKACPLIFIDNEAEYVQSFYDFVDNYRKTHR